MDLSEKYDRSKSEMSSMTSTRSSSLASTFKIKSYRKGASSAKISIGDPMTATEHYGCTLASKHRRGIVGFQYMFLTATLLSMEEA